MEIKRETVTTILTTDGKEIHAGDMCVFVTKDSKGMFGRFVGLTNKGSVEFEVDNMVSESFTFAVMPKSIRWIYLADVNIKNESEVKA